MKKLAIFIVSLLVITLIGCQNETKVQTKIETSQLKRVGGPITTSNESNISSNELGIESITELKDGSYEINVYALNIDPIAGIQFELIPNNIFEIKEIYGGRCDKSGFMLKSNERGVMLGFSMQGNIVEPSNNSTKSSNLLFSLKANLISTKSQETLSLAPVLAGQKGKTLSVDSVPYTWIKG
jgi:hypothetical protein